MFAGKVFAGRVFVGKVFAGHAVASRFGDGHRSGRVCLVTVVLQLRQAKVRVVGPSA